MCFYPWVWLAWAKSMLSLHAWSTRRLGGGSAEAREEAGAGESQTLGLSAVWFIWTEQVETRRCFLRHPGPPLAEKAQTQGLLEMPRDYSRRVDFETPAESFMRQIPDFPKVLTLTCDLQVTWEPGAWVLD